ncbi:MAG: hypothetical protein QHH05_07925 [Syntrophomonadaceae bacterium]|jgi:hypothetical protein|nr:hypothetical protein [Syntrophomonadaceae bacterium]MDH7498350.1 hypothetical protein [Syntrophomonadaceae bacterium]
MVTSHSQNPGAIPFFRIGGDDLHAIAREQQGTEFNLLSPFRGQPVGGAALSREAVALAQDEEFQSMLQVLVAPDLRVTMRHGGPAVPYTASSLYGRKVQGRDLLVALSGGGGMLSASLFSSVEQYAGYFAARFAFPTAVRPLNAIPSPQPLEVILFILVLADCYRRAYLGRMLEYSLEPVDGIYEDELVTVLERELEARDPRWLLPAVLMLVPGLEGARLEFSGRQVELAQAMDFISRMAHPVDGRPVYLLGTRGRYLGLEFSLFWKQALGLQLHTLDGGGKAVVEGTRGFLAPTEEANHFMEFVSAGSGVEVVHRALTAEGVADTMRGLLAEVLAARERRPGAA